MTTGEPFRLRPAYEPVVWTQDERARGQAWGVKTVESFHTYGTPTLERHRGTADPADEQIPARRRRDD